MKKWIAGTIALIVLIVFVPLLDASTIDNGWYSATVKYFNYNTSESGTYTLNVQAENDRIVTIAFPNGGSLHTGYNNHGYTYSGGYLNFERNYNGNIVAATTKVTIYLQGGGIATYSIRIE